MVLRRIKKWLFGAQREPEQHESVDDAGQAEHSSKEQEVRPPPSWHKYAVPAKPVPTHDDLIDAQAHRLVEMVNESLDIAQNSSDPETRISRLGFAEQKIQELTELFVLHPRIKMQHVDGVRAEIGRLRSVVTATVSFSDTVIGTVCVSFGLYPSLHANS